MEYDLKRFLDAQERNFEQAFVELKNGRKRNHWMWYIFPQLKGLGLSETSKFYGLDNLEEATQYHEHPILGKRLVVISKELLKLKETDPMAIFGQTDHLKLHSSMTLFALVSGTKDSVFRLVLEKFFGGKLDQQTLNLLSR